MGIDLSNVRSYVSSLSWFEGGLLAADVLQVLDFLETTPDSRWLVAETKRCVIIVRHWQEQLRLATRRIEIQLLTAKDQLDEVARDSLARAGRQIRQRRIDAFAHNDKNYAGLVDAHAQYEAAWGVLDGIAQSLNVGLVVQEALSARRQEIIDSSTP